MNIKPFPTPIHTIWKMGFKFISQLKVLSLIGSPVMIRARNVIIIYGSITEVITVYQEKFGTKNGSLGKPRIHKTLLQVYPIRTTQTCLLLKT